MISRDVCLDELAPPLIVAGATRRALLASLGLSTLIAVGLAVTDGRLLHWFVLPVLACGVLAGLDAWDWASGRINLFSPVGILGVVGYHLFFLAPILHVHWDYWLPLVDPPADWRPWLGGMALLNLAGLALYRSARSVRLGWPRSKTTQRWTICPRRFLLSLTALLTVAVAVQVAVYHSFGGIAGFILAFATDEAAFRGKGALLMIGESFAILAFMGVVVAVARRGRHPSWPVTTVMLLAFLILQIAVGGLRGSRGNVVWGLFWAVGLVHLWWRRIPRRAALGGLGVLILFMVGYSYYKSYGPEVLSALTDPQVRVRTQRYEGRPLVGVLLNDFARSDVQSFLLYRIESPGSDYRLAWGATYAGSLALLVPRAVWADRPATKVKMGTDAMYGLGAHVPERFQTSRVFGLAGEALLNFGPLGVLLLFALFGLMVGALCRATERLAVADSRLLMYPFLVNLIVSSLINDSENVLFSLFKNGMMPGLLVWMGSRRGAVPCVRDERSEAQG